MKTMCPLKFNAKTLDEEGSVFKSDCQCEKDECELWTDMYTTETVRVSGCAIRMNAMKNSDGLIVV